MNRRRFQRVSVHLDAEVSDGNVSLMARETRDLSLQGLFLVTEVTMPVGTECRITLWLRGLLVPIELQFTGKVARVAPDGLGIQFHAIENLESYHHLRNLVLYNSHDPDSALEEEAAALEPQTKGSNGVLSAQ